MTGETYDAPNQQVVRPDHSAPWEEGTGGSKRGRGSSKEGGSKKSSAKKKEADEE